MTTHIANGYLILEAQRGYWTGDDGLKKVAGVRVAGFRKGRPAKLERDQIAVKIGITVDAAEFSPITAELALALDPSRVIYPVVEDLEPGGEGE
ncbi:hypothetical protein PP568_13130 [Mycobacteroides abscessus]|jgi:hypothetical protein|uniref:Uncharacterized protein n=2 Tax=Mycobacteroides abscessus TaxID=36809 RepID=A0AB38D3P7_9MYCO|nr:hypothetical protein [Mycobacteroides abscessus]QSM03228.1 hypothetical protein PROPHIGD102-2_24 [Mycobacterium phage prophi102-2]QSM03998.1 hypothetical protein PROPHIGD54-1_24 [Mycobacterium phage prophiGD54-1]MBE5420175.1 hypothetical protein [Mycobacteroides abscessus]MBE5455126.1 hypothetical protein [Mycobacteroides abscessus]MDM2404373.1 hypothetical protein [Mycobacteroides abscessus]